MLMADHQKCQLSKEEQQERKEFLKEEVFKKVETVRETEKGVELEFHEKDDFYTRLVEKFINPERDCCPFFAFNLSFSAEKGPVSLEIVGSERDKEIIIDSLEEYGLKDKLE